MVDFADISLPGVILAAAANMALGAAWYSKPAFGDQWLELTGKTRDQLGKTAPAMTVAALSSLITAGALAIVLLGIPATHWIDGLGWGALVGVAFVAMTFAVDYVFAGRPIALYLLNATYHVIAFALMGAILGALN